MKEFICIICPKGCNLNYHDDTVTGNACKKGEEYAISEGTNPMRFITSTVALKSGGRCPVRTSSPVPKSKMMNIMKEIRAISVNAPLEVGDIIVRNISDSGADLIATSRAESDA